MKLDLFMAPLFAQQSFFFTKIDLPHAKQRVSPQNHALRSVLLDNV